MNRNHWHNDSEIGGTKRTELAKRSDRLVIVGYGCRDSKINELILENFDYQNKKAVIIDPFPSDDVKSFGKKIKASILEKKPNEGMLEV